MRLQCFFVFLCYSITQAFTMPLSQFLRLATSDNYHNDPSIAALPSVEGRIYRKVYVQQAPVAATEKYDRFIRNSGIFDFRPMIRHPYEYRLQ